MFQFKRNEQCKKLKKETAVLSLIFLLIQNSNSNYFISWKFSILVPEAAQNIVVCPIIPHKAFLIARLEVL